MKKLTKTYMANTMVNADFWPAIYEFGGHNVFKYKKTNSIKAYNKAKARAINHMRYHTGGTNAVENMWARFLKSKEI